MRYSTEPSQVRIDDTIVSAVVAFVPDRWDVTVILSRSAGAEPIGEGDLEAQGLDADGAALHALGRPSYPLIESGGSLGRSANAEFQFAGDRKLAEILVEWRGTSARFSVLEAELP